MFLEPKDVMLEAELMTLVFKVSGGDLKRLVIVIVTDKGNKEYEFDVSHLLRC